MIYKTQGVCARTISFEVVDNKIYNVAFEGGCRGNTTGISKLVEGMNIDDVISRLECTKCRPTTSCPDQLAEALKKYREENNL
jgi:uncharacterized protein (TIGR03905 family)